MNLMFFTNKLTLVHKKEKHIIICDTDQEQWNIGLSNN